MEEKSYGEMEAVLTHSSIKSFTTSCLSFPFLFKMDSMYKFCLLFRWSFVLPGLCRDTNTQKARVCVSGVYLHPDPPPPLPDRHTVPPPCGLSHAKPSYKLREDTASEMLSCPLSINSFANVKFNLPRSKISRKRRIVKLSSRPWISTRPLQLSATHFKHISTREGGV